MAEVPSAQARERPRQPMTRAMKLRAAAILSVLVAIPGVGGFVGYQIGQNKANASRRGDIAAANQDKNCIKLESEYAKPGHPAMVRLGALTARQQVDCGVDWVGSSITSTSNPYSGYNTPQGTIITSGVEVRLPSIKSLEDNIPHEYAQAAHPYSTFDKITDPAIGALVGLMGDAVGLMGVVGVATLIERRRNSAAPPPPAGAKVAP